MVEEAAAAAESLVEQAMSLMENVSAFKLSGGADYAGQSVQRSTVKAVSRPTIRTRSKPEAKAAPAKLSANSSGDEGDWEEF